MNTTPIDSEYEKILYGAMCYALGRRTYIVHTVARYIKKLLPYISLDMLMIMQQEIENTHAFGDELDEEQWMNLYIAIINEIKRKYKHEG